jgi:O-antigen ligase
MQLRQEPSGKLSSSHTGPHRFVRASFDGLLFAFALVAFAWLPFWFGSERPIAWGINAVVFGSLVILYEVGVLWRGRGHPVAMHRMALSALSLAIVAAWCLLQVSTSLPAGFQNSVWQLARETLASNLPGSISVNRDTTIIALLRLSTAASVFWLMLQLCRSSSRARSLVAAIAVIGAAYATYGIVAFFGSPNTILWFTKVYYLDSLTSTFVNRNTYATYAAIGLVCALAKLTNVLSEAVASGVGRIIPALVAAVIGPAGVWLAIASVIAAALVLTGSRAGIAAALTGVAAGALVAGLQRRSGRMATLLGTSAVAVVFLGAVLVSFGDLLASRLTQQGVQAPDRIAVYELTLQSIADKPVAGFGYGTFEHVFPMYRDARLGAMRVWDRAHNTYLEIVQGLGIPAALVFLAGMGALLQRCFAGALTRRRSVTAPLAASAASVAVLLHAFVDFSLQSQAVALTWIALVGAGVAQSWSSRIATDA